MNKIDLKQCPFCGGKAESLTPWAGGVYGYWVRCEACRESEVEKDEENM